MVDSNSIGTAIYLSQKYITVHVRERGTVRKYAAP
nr:MAG TPA: hypothetical protein [Caudoviricetes sp.]